MLEQEKELRKAGGPPPAAAVIAIALLLAVGTVAFFWWNSRAPEQVPQLTAEARQYLEHLQLGGVEMKAEETFLKQTIVAIEGGITNNGNRTLSLIEVNCVFREPYGVEVAREPALIVSDRTGSLHPGETQSFRLAFDTIPPEWNQAMPSLFISQIQFD